MNCVGIFFGVQVQVSPLVVVGCMWKARTSRKDKIEKGKSKCICRIRWVWLSNARRREKTTGTCAAGVDAWAGRAARRSVMWPNSPRRDCILAGCRGVGCLVGQLQRIKHMQPVQPCCHWLEGQINITVSTSTYKHIDTHKAH